jgi:zinc/manganese transport system substrate-binding protein
MKTVITTTPEIAAIAREVGGNLVRVESIAKPDQNYHTVEAKPTDVVRVARSDVFVRVGLDLESWADSLLNAAQNPAIQQGGKGYVDAGRLIKKKEVRTSQVSMADGDIHVLGNPHYWLDPANAKVVAYEIDLALRGIDPQNAAAYDANYKKFGAEIDKRLSGWKQALAPFSGKSVVTYHAEWVYFFDQFSLKPGGYLEPKPGIPPSGAHINNLIKQMKSSGTKGIVVPSIYPMRFADLVAKETGGKAVTVPYSVGSMGTSDYFNYMDAIVNGFRKALS